MEWTKERIELLTDLWKQGHSASQIATQLGNVTRNAVIGKAHRLGLTGRPSPIKKVPRKSTKGSVAVTAIDKEKEKQKKIAKYGFALGIGRSCAWPIGDPKTPTFHFCGEPVEPSRPYCPKHCAIAYHRKTDAA